MVWQGNEGNESSLESDSRFPSGPWTGFFLDKRMGPARSWMSLGLVLREGAIQGEGSDCIGDFCIRGRYDTEAGEVWMHKTYVGQHEVHYRGVNEGKGIWGVWEMSDGARDGFHIWPEDMEDPTDSDLSEETDLTASAPCRVCVGGLVGAGCD